MENKQSVTSFYDGATPDADFVAFAVLVIYCNLGDQLVFADRRFFVVMLGAIEESMRVDRVKSAAVREYTKVGLP